MDDIRFRGLIQNAGLEKIANTNKNTLNNKNISAPEKDFRSILSDKINELKFSKHATERLSSRGVLITDDTMEKLNSAVDNASKKGVSDLVAINEQSAFIINVSSRTVITAMNKAEMQENIFTNINGAVFF